MNTAASTNSSVPTSSPAAGGTAKSTANTTTPKPAAAIYYGSTTTGCDADGFCRDGLNRTFEPLANTTASGGEIMEQRNVQNLLEYRLRLGTSPHNSLPANSSPVSAQKPKLLD